MNKIITYPQENGVVAIIIPTPEFLETNSIEDVAAKDVPEGLPFKIIDESEIPTDWAFRDAWEFGDTIKVNIEKAKTITTDRLRRERAPLLQAQDVAFQRALEANADTSVIVAEKQRLRDVTKLVDTAKTLDDLKAITC
jgi:hypothetical protein